MNCPLAIIVPEFGARSETFIRRHVQDLLPGRVLAIGGPPAPATVRDWEAEGPLVDLGAVSGLRAVGRWLQEYGVEVLLSQYLDASLEWLDLANELGLRFFVHGHGHDVSQRRLRDPLYRREYLRYRDVAGVITMSETSRAQLIELGLSPSRTHAVPYGVDVPDTCPEHPLKESVRLLAAGRMVPVKAPILTLDAFRRARQAHPELQLDYVGAGPLRSAAIQFVTAFNLEGQVLLHGGLPNPAVHTLMGESDIFVHHGMTDPDKGDEEGLPVVILEAMAAGLPVVSTRHAGIPEEVEDGVTGFLVQEGDSIGMADRIERLARDHGLRRQMGVAGWERARERFTWCRERDSLLQILGFAES